MPALAAVMVLRSEYSIPATNAIGWLAIAAAVTGASAVVAKSAPPPSTVSRHCFPDVKLATEISSPCFSNSPLALAMMARPEIGPRFCARRAFRSSSACAALDATIGPHSTADAANAASKVLVRGMSNLHWPPARWQHTCDHGASPDRRHRKPQRPPVGPIPAGLRAVEAAPLVPRK